MAHCEALQGRAAGGFFNASMTSLAACVAQLVDDNFGMGQCTRKNLAVPVMRVAPTLGTKNW